MDESVKIYVNKNAALDTRIEASSTSQFYWFKAEVYTEHDADTVFEILTHPHSSNVMRGIDGCNLRTLLKDDGCGTLLLLVENQTDWNVCNILRGSLKTRLVVQQNPYERTMEFSLAPNHHCPMMKELHGVWNINQLPSGGCIISTEQCVAPDHVPRFLNAKFMQVIGKQILTSLEDILLECEYIKLGQPRLPPYDSMEEIGVCDVDPDSVLDNVVWGGSSNASTTTSTASRVSSAQCYPLSHPVYTGIDIDRAASRGSYYFTETNSVVMKLIVYWLLTLFIALLSVSATSLL